MYGITVLSVRQQKSTAVHFSHFDRIFHVIVCNLVGCCVFALYILQHVHPIMIVVGLVRSGCYLT